MKIAILHSFVMLCAYSLYAQTPELEKQYFSERFKNGEFSQEKYVEYAKSWQKLLEDFDGYPELPYDEERGQVRYQTTVSIPNADKKTIYKRLKEWAAINKGALTEYLRYEDFESGRLIISGRVPVAFKQDFQGLFKTNESANLAESYGVFVFTYSNDKLKIELTEIEYTFKYRYDAQASLYNPYVKQYLSNLYPVVGSDELFWKQRLSLLESTNDSFLVIAKAIEIYVNDYKRDWEVDNN